MQDNPLGKAINYTDVYSPSLLFPIARSQGRLGLGIKVPVPFDGVDRWSCYEVSWLADNGLPQVGIATISYSALSTNIVESKSLKLYLGSLNFKVFENVSDLENLITCDLLTVLGAESGVVVSVLRPSEWQSQRVVIPKEECIDSEAVEREAAARLVADEDRVVEEALYSDLLRSLCPVTSQPDWGTVRIAYTGNKINRASLLAYLIAHRSYQGYHEECCERIFSAIKACCNPKKLWVGCFYTRRGGIDINPERWLEGTARPNLLGRLPRQ